MGTALLTEYEDVLARQSLFEGYRLGQSERDELLDIFLARCQWTRIFFGWRPNLPDEGDNHLFELAVAATAKKIVTRNLSDLQGGELKFKQIQVLSPERLLEEIDE